MTLDLAGYKLENTGSPTGVTASHYAGKGDVSAIVIGDQMNKNAGGRTDDYDKTVIGNQLTIVGNGSINATTGNGIYIFGPGKQLTDDKPVTSTSVPNVEDHTNYAKLIVGTEGGSDEINIKGGGSGISGNGAPAPYADITINTTGTIEGTRAGIYNPQVGKLTINSGTIKGTDTTDGCGIEIRGGELVVNGGTISAGSGATSLNYAGTINGNSTKGAGIAVAQHTTKTDVTVNINNGDISGYVALSVTNPTNQTEGTITVNAKGGTLESKSTDKTASADSNENTSDGWTGTVKLNKLTGKNAIFNGDSRVKISVENTVIKGALAGILTGRTDDAYELKEGNTYSNFTGDSTALFPYYYATKTDGTVIDAAILGTEGWNTTAIENNWAYVVAPTEEESVGTALTQLIADSTKGAFSLTSGANTTASIVSFDATNNLFKDLTYTSDGATKYYTIINASSANSLTLFNITGNDKITSIVGGAGADSLKAGVNGATLNGGAGNDSLVAVTGTKANTFLYQSGKDTIDGYTYDTDIVSLTGENLTLPTEFSKAVFDSSNFNISLGNDDANVLVFKATSNVAIGYNDDTYTYTSKSIALDNKNSHGISLGAGWTSDFNGTKEAYENYATIDAAKVTKTIKITGNDNANSIVGGTGGGTLLGGDNKDTLVAGGGSTTLNGGDDNDLLIGNSNVGNYNLFVYSAGKDSIENYKAGDLINVTGKDVSFSEVTATKSNNDLLIKFDDSNSMSIQGGADLDSGISVASGKRTYLFTAGSIALDKSITLTSDFAGTSFDKGDAYDTINAAAVTKNDISIKGNANANYLVGSTDKKNTLEGGSGNDTLVGGTLSTAEDTFIYSAGKDVIENFNADNDKLSIDSTKIESGKATSNKLTFTINKKSDVLTFNFGDSDIESVSTGENAYLTKDGYVKDNALKLFSSAKGNITAGTGLYSGVSTVDAEAVKKQGVTLVGSASGGLYKFNGSNKQKDGFTYVGGTVSISGYEGGKDRIDLGAASISSFKIENTNDVVLNIGNGTESISIAGAKDAEFLLRENNKNSKLVFKADGVLENKAKNPTMATVSAGAKGTPDFSSKVKKIFAVGDVSGIKLQAGNNNTVIDASKAGGVSLSGGNKNDKLIGSSAGDVFIYGAGKDIIQGFGSSDSISLTVGDKSLQDSLTSAKITKSNSTIKFKFDNKNTLTIKADKENTTFKNGQLQINDTNYTYLKNAVQATNGTVSLTSSFGGTFKTTDDTQQTIDGHLVKNNLTFVGSTRGETFIGSDENKKTTFKGGGGTDILVGGESKDTFFYAKSYTGDAEIQRFDFAKDKLKVASGKIGSISSISGGGGIVIGMTSGQKNSSAIVGSFKITSQKDNSGTIDPSKVAFKANNTLYWFASDDDASKYVSADDETAITAGKLITTENRLSALPTGLEASVIDLNYSTNLAKSGVAIKVKEKST